jgi:hypothetical protein
MKNNTNTTATMSNTNTTAIMNNTKFHIVLRDKHNELVSWRGFKDGESATLAFIHLSEYLIKATDGDFHWEEKGAKTYLVNSSGLRLSLCLTNPSLLMEIIFCDTPIVADMFHSFLNGEVE